MQVGDAPFRDEFQEGFSYLIVMFSLTFFSIGLSVVAPWVSELDRRQREEEFVAQATLLSEAIAEYYRQSPTTPKAFPKKLDHLVEDNRFVGTKRFLRRVPFDPLTRTYDWGLETDANGQIVGFFSKSDRKPLRRFPPASVDGRPDAQHYREWVFRPSVK